MAAVVRVRNVGQVDFIDAYGGQQVVIPAGGEIICDGEWPSLWLGFPGIRDDPVKDYYPRRELYYRLRMRYGWHAGMNQEYEWDLIRPQLEVYRIDNGERIWMVLDDPTGEQGGAEPIKPHDEVAWLKEMVERQESELAALREAIKTRAGQAEGLPDDVPEDEPRPPEPARAPAAAGGRRGRAS